MYTIYSIYILGSFIILRGNDGIGIGVRRPGCPERPSGAVMVNGSNVFFKVVRGVCGSREHTAFFLGEKCFLCRVSVERRL